MSVVTVEEAKRSKCIGPSNCGRERECSSDRHTRHLRIAVAQRYCTGPDCKMGWRAVEPNDKCQIDGRWEPIRRGYCGLGGKP